MNERTIKNSSNSYLYRFKKVGLSEAQLVCFPYAGASANIFRPWMDILPPSIDFYGVQYKGRGYRMDEPQETSVFDIVNDIFIEIQALLDKPIVLFGHSLGALIAYELSRTLSEKNIEAPTHLIVSGLTPPHINHETKRINHLPDNEFLREIAMLNGTPAEVLKSADLIKLVLPALRADLHLAENWSFTQRGVLSVPISALAGKSDGTVPVELVPAWENSTSGPVSIHLFSGDHFFIDAHLEEIVGLISERLCGDGPDAAKS